MTGFKKGDRVEVIDGSGATETEVGDKGTVVSESIYCGTRFVTVDLDKGITTEVWDTRFKLIEALKVGDRVVVGANVNDDPPGLASGTAGIVRQYHNDRYLVDFEGWLGGHTGSRPGFDVKRSHWWVEPKHLSLAPTEKKSRDKFRVGDRIKCLMDDYPFMFGDFGHIVRNEGDGYPYAQKENDSRRVCINERRFELAAPIAVAVAPKPEVKFSLPIGSRIIVVDAGGGFGRTENGNLGVVRGYWQNGVTVEMDNGETSSVYPFRVALMPPVAAFDWKTVKVGDWVSVKDEHIAHGRSMKAGEYQVIAAEFPGYRGPMPLRLMVNGDGFWPHIKSIVAIVPVLRANPIAEFLDAKSASAPEKPQTFIVVSDEGPSSRPFKHPSRGAAEAEAGRLALVKPGMKFTVYQAVSAAKAPKLEATLETFDFAA